MNFRHVAGFAVASALALYGPGAAAMVSPAAPTGANDTVNVKAEPNITGVWERYPSPFPEDSDGFDDVQPPGDGPDLEEPYASQWKAQRAKRAAALKAGTPLVDPSTQCLPEGMPTIMQAIYPIQILQTPGQITVLAEIFMQTRRIYLDTPFPKPDDLAPTYTGFSSAHWKGDTLVIETRGVREDVEFFEIPHSDAMTITEHYRLIADDMLQADISIKDPGYLKTPYNFTWVYKRNDNYQIPEYVCDNRLDVINPDGTVSFDIQ
ncbi:hypothetical protein [Rhizorhapis sp. SPR117]|uniref:hypothetical protein n=1 Tax=Rhizorhapis sp. SPR117 TaxID=2912611 RepID=UPI001F16E7D1|nr:hypothetical protein [Rhizorhapis sp. SPR117]